VATELKRPLIERYLVFSNAGAGPSRVRCQSVESFYVELKRFPGMSRSLLNIAKRPLPRLTLRGGGLTSKDAVS
jgi:hypothetical protein